MADIKIHAGTFQAGNANLKGDKIALPLKPKQGLWNREYIELAKLHQIEIATEESVKRVGGSLAWGAAGALVFGPVGLLVGLLAGGRKKEITFVAKFENDQIMLGTAETDTYKKLMAVALRNNSPPE